MADEYVESWLIELGLSEFILTVCYLACEVCLLLQSLFFWSSVRKDCFLKARRCNVCIRHLKS